MHHEPIQQKESAIQQSALESSGFDSGDSVSASPAAFQLKATNDAVQRSTGGSSDVVGDVMGSAASKGLDTSNIDVEMNSSKPAEVGAVATHQFKPDGGSSIAVASGSTTQMKENLGHELGHAFDGQKNGYTPQADTSIGGVGVDTNKAAEDRADSFSASL